jgi:hypothetical protein
MLLRAVGFESTFGEPGSSRSQAEKKRVAENSLAELGIDKNLANQARIREGCGLSLSGA